MCYLDDCAQAYNIVIDSKWNFFLSATNSTSAAVAAFDGGLHFQRRGKNFTNDRQQTTTSIFCRLEGKWPGTANVRRTCVIRNFQWRSARRNMPWNLRKEKMRRKAKIACHWPTAKGQKPVRVSAQKPKFLRSSCVVDEDDGDKKPMILWIFASFPSSSKYSSSFFVVNTKRTQNPYYFYSSSCHKTTTPLLVGCFFYRSRMRREMFNHAWVVGWRKKKKQARLDPYLQLEWK